MIVMYVSWLCCHCIDSFTVSHKRPLTVPLHSANCARGLSVAFCETVGIPTDHVSSKYNVIWDNPDMYLHQPIKKGWFQPIGGLASYPIDSPNATRLGLFNSLAIATYISWFQSISGTSHQTLTWYNHVNTLISYHKHYHTLLLWTFI